MPIDPRANDYRRRSGCHDNNSKRFTGILHDEIHDIEAVQIGKGRP